MTATRTSWQNIRLYIWLIGGLLCLLASIVFWLLTDTKKLVLQENPIEDAQVAIQPEKVAASSHLGALLDEVRPLEMTTRVVASGNHEAEFRGTKFIQDNKNKWTIELFRVTKEDVIKAFLAKNLDHRNLFYFRLSGEGQTEQYILAYGVYGSESEAKSQIAQLDIALPKSLHPQTQQLGSFAGFVNDLGADELTAGTNAQYEVRLKNAPVPVVDEATISQPKPVATPAQNVTTTKTTVTRKDADGNVVDVKKSSSSADSSGSKAKENSANPSTTKKTPEHEISDPFN